MIGEPTVAAWSPREQRLMRRATLVFPASGRLGNQLFQYSALREFLTAEQRLVLLDFDALAAAFTGLRADIRSSTRLLDRARLSLRHRARHLVGSPIGRIVQARDDHLPSWSVPGSIATVRGYFQRDHPGHERHVGPLRMLPHVEAEADAFLARRLAGTSAAPVAFVHVRRGDYLHSVVGHKEDGLSWVDDGPPVALPAGWYRERMTELRDTLPGVRFLLVGDDPGWAERELSGPDTTVSDRAPLVDLALLARCDAGVLSASSFAWWGAWFARYRSEHRPSAVSTSASHPVSGHAAGPFLAPLHWLGHAVGEWWPEHVETPFLAYRPVVTTSLGN